MTQEIAIGEFSSYGSSLIGALNSLHWGVWDCGPEAPRAPVKPKLPAGKEGDPEYDLAKIELQDQIVEYGEALKRYGQQKREHEAWGGRGPVLMIMWSTDARDAIRYDQHAVQETRQTRRRYYPYDKNKPDLGLPFGLRPGSGQAAIVQREVERASAAYADAAADPQFGRGAV